MIARRLLRLVALLVPAHRRAGWLEEWEAELWQLRAHSSDSTKPAPVAPLSLCLGAVPHALWLRRHQRPTSQKSRDPMHTIIQDLRFAARSFRRNPGFSAIAIVTLALGIGATTAIFSIVDSVLLTPLPYYESDNLVMVGGDSEFFGGVAPMSGPDFYELRERNQVLDFLVAIEGESLDLVGTGEPERVQAAGVAAGYFEMLGVPPVMGRTILPEDDQASAEPVAVLSHGLWQRRWGGDTHVIGTRVAFGERSFTVVGIMPPDFTHPEGLWSSNVEMWFPLTFIEQDLQTRNTRFLQMMGRLRPGVSLYQGTQRVNALWAAMAEEYGWNDPGTLVMVPLEAQTVGDIGSSLYMLLGAVGLLMLISCANVANLFLARATGRRQEVALRVALGAGAGRIRQQLLTEGVSLALAGGLLGTVLAVVSVRAFVTLGAGNIPRTSEISIDARVLAFALALSVATGVLFALVPAWRASREKATGVLNEGAGRATTPFGRHALRHALVAGEIGLALVLLVGAGLFINSFVRLRGIDPGFQPDDVVTMTLRLGPGYDTPEDRLAFYNPVLDRLREIPGVESASLSSGLPFLGGRSITFVRIEGDEGTPGERERLDFSVVTPDYFRTLQIAMLDGRDFLPTDDANHEDVMIVNEAFAHKHWPAESAVDKRVRLGGGDDWITIVGVVANVRRFALDQAAEPEGFLPMRQSRRHGGLTAAVRAPGNTAVVMSAMRRAAWDLNPNLPINMSTLNQELAGSITTPRFHTLVLSGFAAIALILAAVGIYGTMSYTVGQRTRELGIRMALGAAAPDVIGLVVRQGLILIVVGVGLGIAGALAASRILASFLYGVSATDMMTFSLGAAVLTVVALAASYIPARRATSVDCMETLRQE